MPKQIQDKKLKSPRSNVYPLKPHIGLSENIPTYTEKNMMTNSDAEQLKRFLQAENTYEGKILCPK